MFFFVINLSYLCITILNYTNKPENNKSSILNEKYNISIQVLNGVGEPGLARFIRNKLIDLGLNVLSFENAEKFIYGKTVIIIRTVNPQKLKILMEILPLDKVYRQTNKDSIYDFIVIIGRDYKNYFDENESI
ncbi:MAG: LytR C-terminal domain-containing protein [Candidatus Cloacimonetes bacterium]|nr:LytR C-terminal domain-containing protein [Candidatus Cloacimonadota bacterium]